MRGVAHQPGGASNVSDPIADTQGCLRDVENFKRLGLNTIRVYTVDNTANHDECMSALADAGIYLALDVNTPLYSINRADPHPSYNADYLQNIFATIDVFQEYDNTLLFFSGNEVINDPETSNTAPYIKAVTRDIRTYIRNRGYRSIPVGYSAADVSENRMETAQYMNCGTEDERSDFFAFNDYSWCSPSDFITAGWDQKVQNFTGYGLPIFLSEYGCNTNTRDWGEVASLYHTNMTGVYSGGLAYEYTQEPNDYGLVELGPGGELEELDDFQVLADAMAATSDPSGDGGYDSETAVSECPPFNDPNWLVRTDSLPSIPQGALQYMDDGAGPGPGLTGSGSHFAGGASTGTATAGSGEATRTGSAGGSTGTTSGSGSGSENAAASVVISQWSVAPLVCGAIVVLSSMVGSSLL